MPWAFFVNWPRSLRLMVRTAAFQAVNRGSIPLGTTSCLYKTLTKVYKNLYFLKWNMATSSDFKSIAEQRLKTVEFLMANQEWGVAVYIMGFVLECVLKTLTCKVLNLSTYPEVQSTKNQKITSYFLTHDFDMLLIISGASQIFGLSGEGASSWSGFTQEYTKSGAWTSIRYEAICKFDEKTTRKLYAYLTAEPDGIIPILERKELW